MYSKCIIRVNCLSHGIHYKTRNLEIFLKRLIGFPGISVKLKNNNSEILLLRKKGLFT